MLWPYIGVFLGSLAVDTIPVFAPPAWTIMVLMAVKFKLNPWVTGFIGALGSTVGRWVLSRYMPKVAERAFNDGENDNIRFLGSRLGGNPWRAFLFTLGYCCTPLSSTALFTAAGAARVNVWPILPAFFIGKFASDVMMIYAGRGAIRGVGDILKGQASPKGLIMSALGILLIGAVLFIDWRELLQRKRLKFRFRIWRTGGSGRRSRRASRSTRRGAGARARARRWSRRFVRAWRRRGRAPSRSRGTASRRGA